MKRTKVLFIGAGVGNLLAANYLSEQFGNDFLILEKGMTLEARQCPGVQNSHCQHCAVCQIESGTGGANALHGNKLCHFPASHRIVDFGGKKWVGPAMAYIRQFSRTITNGAQPQCEQLTSVALKAYHSDILPQVHFAELIRNLTQNLKKHIYNQEEVTGIYRLNGSFVVETKWHTYETEQVVIGTGRSSYRFLEEFLSQNAYGYRRLSPDIGIRVEGSPELFSDLYYYQADPKLKFDYPEGCGRTFCAHNQGMVVPVKLGKSSYADGAFGNFSTRLNNIALMVRSTVPLPIDKLEQWAERINQRTGGSLLMGEVSMTDPQYAIQQILGLLEEFPSQDHARLFTRLLEDLFAGERAIFRFDPQTPLKMKIYAPAIDRYWVRPELNRDFSVKGDPGIYIIGDAVGLSRGFLQAMFAGYVWARNFVEKTIRHSNHYDKIRCGRLSSGLCEDAVRER